MNMSEFFSNDEFNKFFVGYEDQLNRINNFCNTAAKSFVNYPPYNIVKVNEDNYVVELALAGFTEEDINVEVQERVLTVSSTKHSSDDNSTYIHRGLAFRTFKRSFALGEDLVVKNANLLNGLLKIEIERVVPDHKKPRKISIGTNKQLLTENSLLNT